MISQIATKSLSGIQSNVHIQKHFTAAPPLFQRAPVKMTQGFKGLFMVLMTNEQDYYITDKKNTLRNPACTLCGL